MMETKKKIFGIVEKTFYANGYHCLVVFTVNGVRNGYIGIPKTHKLFGVGYHDKHECLKVDDCKGKKFNGNIIGLFCGDHKDGILSPDLYFSAHCGFTYSAQGSEMPEYYDVDKDWWYFGFDCNHCDDGKDFEQAYKYGLLTLDEFNIQESIFTYGKYNPVRSMEYVEENLRTIADELEALED